MKFILRFIVVEYIILASVMLYAFGMSILSENEYLKNRLEQQENVMSNLSDQVIQLQSKPMAVTVKKIEEDKVYLGKFKITHYCACKKCCGPNAQGITASGKRVEENKTIAVDPTVIKLGSQVYIDGYGYMEAQDTGSAIKGNIIDVYIADHQEALQLGVVYKDVYLVK